MILDRFNLTDRVAIVTGAGKGIGAGCALALADAGAHVALAARTESDLEAVAEQIDARHRRALVVPTDVTEREQLEHLVARTADELGGVDILVNNAGGWDPRPLLQHEPAQHGGRVQVQRGRRVLTHPALRSAPRPGRATAV